MSVLVAIATLTADSSESGLVRYAMAAYLSGEFSGYQAYEIKQPNELDPFSLKRLGLNEGDLTNGESPEDVAFQIEADTNGMDIAVHGEHQLEAVRRFLGRWDIPLRPKSVTDTLVLAKEHRGEDKGNGLEALAARYQYQCRPNKVTDLALVTGELYFKFATRSASNQS